MGKRKWDKHYEEHMRARAERERKKREKKREEDQMSLHHILPKSRNGKDIPTNLLRMWFYEKHEPYHKLFGDRTLDEAIEFLQRVSRAVSKKKEDYAPLESDATSDRSLSSG